MIAYGLIGASDPTTYPNDDIFYQIFNLLDNLEDLLSLQIPEADYKTHGLQFGKTDLCIMCSFHKNE